MKIIQLTAHMGPITMGLPPAAAVVVVAAQNAELECHPNDAKRSWQACIQAIDVTDAQASGACFAAHQGPALMDPRTTPLKSQTKIMATWGPSKLLLHVPSDLALFSRSLLPPLKARPWKGIRAARMLHKGGYSVAVGV